jgi:hypothetical protein
MGENVNNLLNRIKEQSNVGNTESLEALEQGEKIYTKFQDTYKVRVRLLEKKALDIRMTKKEEETLEKMDNGDKRLTRLSKSHPRTVCEAVIADQVAAAPDEKKSTFEQAQKNLLMYLNANIKKEGERRSMETAVVSFHGNPLHITKGNSVFFTDNKKRRDASLALRGLTQNKGLEVRVQTFEKHKKKEEQRSAESLEEFEKHLVEDGYISNIELFTEDTFKLRGIDQPFKKGDVIKEDTEVFDHLNTMLQGRLETEKIEQPANYQIISYFSWTKIDKKSGKTYHKRIFKVQPNTGKKGGAISIGMKGFGAYVSLRQNVRNKAELSKEENILVEANSIFSGFYNRDNAGKKKMFEEFGTLIDQNILGLLKNPNQPTKYDALFNLLVEEYGLQLSEESRGADGDNNFDEKADEAEALLALPEASDEEEEEGTNDTEPSVNPKKASNL